MKKSPSTLQLALILGLLAVILAIGVFSINSITAPIVEKAALETKNSAFKELVPDADEYVDVTSKAGDSEDILEVYEAKSGSEVLAYLYLVTTVGYGGEIENLVAIDPGTDSIKAIKILSQAETPGLGGNVVESSFQDQYIDLGLSEITVVKNGASKDNNEIDAITASTITSKAVTLGVNIAIEDYLDSFDK